jgi:hypothetical protein
MFRIPRTLGLVGLMLLVSALPALADRWEKLGERTVRLGNDTDVIVVTAKEGKFDKIKFEVKRAAVIFHDVKVHYAGGGIEDVELRGSIPAGGASRVIDLNGSDRVIEKVVFRYESKGKRRGVVQLFGRH